MTKNPLVSVIIPIYKVEQYLRECVDSVIAQTYTNLEIILVDDGSPDKCPEICDEYAKQDNRIKVIHKPNGGLSDARNAGIEIAKGEYLTFVDSDDVIHSQMIEVLMKPILEDRELKMSACQFLKFENREEIKNYNTDTYPKQIEILNYQNISSKCWSVSWAKMYSTELFQDIKFPVGRLHEDEFTTYKLYYEAKNIAYIYSQLYFYRQREGSIMAVMSTKRIIDIHDAFKERIDFYRDKLSENYMYSSSLIDFVSRYNNLKMKNMQGTIMEQWKHELKTYSIKQLTFKQKLNYLSLIFFPKIRRIIDKYRNHKV
jgi:glycosyltransferase involved in cell wall biosynthesis